MATDYRYTSVPGINNKYLPVGRENQVPTYAAAMVITTTFEKTKVWISITGALALTATTTTPSKGDELEIIFTADGSARTVTPGAGFAGLTATTLVCTASKVSTMNFTFDGSNWIETGRTVAA